MAARRKGQPATTREQIVDAALALIDEQGLEACTMRRLGERLGIDASSLYHHVPSQAALFDLVADRIMGAIPTPQVPGPGDDVVAAIVEGSLGYFDAMVAHPKAVQLVTTRPVRSLRVSRPYEALLATLFGAGLDATAALSATGILGWLIIGASQNYAAQLLEAEYSADVAPERLATVVADYPNMARMLAEAEPRPFREDFRAGLNALTIGLLGEHASGGAPEG